MASTMYRHRWQESDQHWCRQTIDPVSRKSDLNATNYGHITWANDPESRYADLDDTIDMGYAAPSVTIREVMDTTSGPFCYFYV